MPFRFCRFDPNASLIITSVDVRRRTCTDVDVRRRTSTYVVVRRRTSSFVDLRRQTSTYVFSFIFATDGSATIALNDNEQQDVFVDKDDVADRSSALPQQAKTTRLLTTTASSIPSHLETSRKTMEDADMNHQPVRAYSSPFN